MFSHVKVILLTFPAESNPSMRIRTSLSLLQFMSDEREPSSDESERPIREVEEAVLLYDN